MLYNIPTICYVFFSGKCHPRRSNQALHFSSMDWTSWEEGRGHSDLIEVLGQLESSSDIKLCVPSRP